MKEGHGGVDEQRVTGHEFSDDPVGDLEEETPGDYDYQLLAPVEGDLEQNRDQPQNQRRQEKGPSFAIPAVVMATPRPCHGKKKTEEGSNRVLWDEPESDCSFSGLCFSDPPYNSSTSIKLRSFLVES